MDNAVLAVGGFVFVTTAFIVGTTAIGTRTRTRVRADEKEKEGKRPSRQQGNAQKKAPHARSS